MIDVLLNKNYPLYCDIVEYLEKATREAEKVDHHPAGTYKYDVYRYDWYGSVTCNKSIPANCEQSFDCERIRNMHLVYLGFCYDVNLGTNGYVSIDKIKGMPYTKITQKMLDNNTETYGFYFDFSHAFILKEPNYPSYHIFNDNPYTIKCNIYPILYMIGRGYVMNDLTDCGVELKVEKNIERNNNFPTRGFNEIKNLIKDSLELKELQKIVKTWERQQHAIIPVEIKDSEVESHEELRAVLDPEYEDWLISLKKCDVCNFCGARIDRSKQKYCSYCGIPSTKLDQYLNDNEQKQENEKLMKQFNMV